MKQTAKLKTLVLSMAMAGSSLAVLAPASVQAGVTGNAGLVSQYIFRGLPQSAGAAAAQAGVDYENESGIYAGLWASEVQDDEIEYDVYGGWSGEVSGVGLSAGVTLYRYTEEVWDKEYDEVNLSASYGGFSLGIDVGNHTGPAVGAEAHDYSVLTASYEYGSVYGLYGITQDFLGEDTDYSWLEVGYSAELAPGADLGLSLINTMGEDTGLGKDGDGDLMMVVGFTKSFDIM
ncbi:TorF family putative porin [Thiomicrospira pelophila]|uniref:TorF family putative porin n=1 Tax=Thiomicrospira pelophila TaxID=934 RepID=UPI0004A6EE05|nr:TorF family putative porin [Thiomicrospira pelophila]